MEHALSNVNVHHDDDDYDDDDQIKSIKSKVFATKTKHEWIISPRKYVDRTQRQYKALTSAPEKKNAS